MTKSIAEQIKSATTKAELNAARVNAVKASQEFASKKTMRKRRRLLENPLNNKLG